MSDPTDARAIAKAMNWPYPNIYGQFVEDELVAVVEQIIAAAKAAPKRDPNWLNSLLQEAHELGFKLGRSDAAKATPQAAPEPVAWRWRIKGGNNMDWTWSVDKPEGPSIHLFEVQPLYAAPPAVTEAAPDEPTAWMNYWMDDGVEHHQVSLHRLDRCDGCKVTRHVALKAARSAR